MTANFLLPCVQMWGICKCLTGCFLNHFPTETTLQTFIDMSRFFFRRRKPEGPDLSSAQKYHLVFHLQGQTVTWNYWETNPYLCGSPSFAHCRLKGWSRSWATCVFSTFLGHRAKRCEDFISYINVSANRGGNEYRFNMLLV